jgi:uncharacterized membrane protein YidH (DUF202 family)
VSGAPPTALAERTTLAWERTALSLVGGAALLARLTADRLGLFSLTGLVVIGPLALWSSAVRGRQVTGRGEGRRDGRAGAALSLGIVVLGMVELASVLVGG